MQPLMRRAPNPLLAAATLLALAVPAGAQNAQDSWHMHPWGMGWGGVMVLGPLLTILLVVLLIALAVPFFRSIGGGSAEPSGRKARDILDERYAKGEIDREEYLRRREDINAD